MSRNVLHLAEYSPHPPGQFTHHLVALAEKASARGRQLWLGLPTSDQPRAWHRTLSDSGWKIALLQRPWGAQAAYLRGLRALIDAAKPDIVHVHFHAASMFAVRLLAPRAVRVMHWHNPPAVSRAALVAMHGLCGPKHIAVSDALGRSIAAACRPFSVEMHAIGNCVRLSSHPTSIESEDLLAVQALRPQKDAATLIATIRLLVDRGWQGHLTWIGGGDVEGAKERARQLGVMNRVEFLGLVDDPGPRFERCALLVLASHFEGQPYVLLEATAHRRAFVATDLPGCREIAGAHADALLVPHEDPEAMAARIQALLRDVTERDTIAASMFEETRRSRTTEAWAERILDLYDVWR